MKRDWDIIRQQLTDIENDYDFIKELPKEPKKSQQNEDDYKKQLQEYEQKEAQVFGHLQLLIESGYVDGIHLRRSLSNNWIYSAVNPRLTMAGHDLLDTMRSNTVWEKIKETAIKKGIELTFDSIKTIGASVLTHLMSSL